MNKEKNSGLSGGGKKYMSQIRIAGYRRQGGKIKVIKMTMNRICATEKLKKGTLYAPRPLSRHPGRKLVLAIPQWVKGKDRKVFGGRVSWGVSQGSQIVTDLSGKKKETIQFEP